MKMKTNGQAERNLDLIHCHLQTVLKQLECVDHVPNGACVIHLPMDDQWLFEENLILAKQCMLEGKLFFFYRRLKIRLAIEIVAVEKSA